MFKKLIGTAAAVMACNAMAAYPPRQLAQFEHVYAVLDQETVTAIAGSAYMKDFCGLKERTTQSEEGHYHGTYIFGRENYIELLGPADRNLDGGSPAPVGLVGVGLNTERVGGLEELKAVVERNGLPVEIHTLHRTLKGTDFEWFRALTKSQTLDNSASKLPLPAGNIFVAEFIPSYLEIPEVDKPPSSGPDDVVSLARYHRRDYGDKLVRDVTGVEVAILRQYWPALRAVLSGAGYTVTDDGHEARATGDVDLKFELVVQPQQAGLREVRFRLGSKPGTQHVEVLGRSQLVVGPEADAVWVF